MVVHPYNRILYSSKKEQTLDTQNNLGGSQRHYIESKNPVSEGHILYDSIYMTFGIDKAVVMRTEQWFPGIKTKGRMALQKSSTREIWGDWTVW